MKYVFFFMTRVYRHKSIEKWCELSQVVTYIIYEIHDLHSHSHPQVTLFHCILYIQKHVHSRKSKRYSHYLGGSKRNARKNTSIVIKQRKMAKIGKISQNSMKKQEVMRRFKKN